MRSDRLLRLPPAPSAAVRGLAGLAPPGAGGLDVRLASTPLARLRGLAGLDLDTVAGGGLLLPRTGSVHTVGMRFALDLVWLDRHWRVLRVDRAVPPRRLRACRGARSVVELPAGAA